MADKYQLVSYMGGLIALMESKEDAGISRGNTLGLEYDRAYEQFMVIIREEHKNSANERKKTNER